jgi:hypothetical protein
MTLIRRRLVALVLIVLAGQVAATASTPAVFGAMTMAESGDADGTVCTCVHAPDAECPMHKRKPAVPAGQDRWCAGCHEGAGAVLTSLVDFVAPLVDRRTALIQDTVSTPVSVVAEHALSLAPPPVSPPPRA